MFATFMCQTVDSMLLHIDPVAQDRLGFDARVAEMKRRRSGDLDRGNGCRPDLIQLLQYFHRGTQDTGERTQFSHTPPVPGYIQVFWADSVDPVDPAAGRGGVVMLL